MDDDSSRAGDRSADRVAAHLRSWVHGQPPGARLPPTRRIAADRGVGPVTVQRAVARLVAEGLVETRPGAGNHVAARPALAVGDLSWQSAALGLARPGVAGDHGSGVTSVGPDVIPFHVGYPGPELLPGHLVRPALRRAAGSSAALLASPGNGLPALRSHVAQELSRSAPGADAVRPEHVMITSGGQSGLVAALRGLARPGDTVVMESPTFWGAIAAARSAGLRVVPVASGPDGIDPGDLDDALHRYRASVVYAQPTFANPTGATWSAPVRRGVQEVLAARRAFLIEDDWARDLALDGDPPPPLAATDPDGHVVHVRSFSKSVSPAVRVAALVARGPAVRRLSTGRWIGDLYVSAVLQHAALDVLRHPGWPRHLRQLRSGLALRRDALLAALARHAPDVAVPLVPRGGLGLWVTLPPGRTSSTVTARCLHAGLAVSPGHEWFPAEPDGEHLRLSFAAAPPDQHDEAARILHRALQP